jgi:hypothetical protein
MDRETLSGRPDIWGHLFGRTVNFGAPPESGFHETAMRDSPGQLGEPILLKEAEQYNFDLNWARKR